jgi:hypothetical protein
MKMNAGGRPSHPALPPAGEAPDPQHAPFVGNRTVADNLHESVQVALWIKLGPGARSIAIRTSDAGVVELRGRVASEQLHHEVVQLVRDIKGVAALHDHITVRGEAHEAPKSQPTIYLRRFCAADEASTSAAIREAIARLDEYFAARGALPGKLLLIYRNLQPQTVTLDIAMPAGQSADAPSGSDLHLGEAPGFTGAETLAGAGFQGLLAAVTELGVPTHGRDHPLVFWQSFEAADFRPWTGHPAARVHLGN